MKTREEIEALALKEYPNTGFYGIHEERQRSFIRGFELAQEETQRLETINAELRDALEDVIESINGDEYSIPSYAYEQAEQALENANK